MLQSVNLGAHFLGFMERGWFNFTKIVHVAQNLIASTNVSVAGISDKVRSLLTSWWKGYLRVMRSLRLFVATATTRVDSWEIGNW